MDKDQAGKMLAEANMAADQVAQMDGVMGNPPKAPIIGMIIQNLHESLLAFDKGVDVTGAPISPEEIGEGLKGMLDHLRDQSHWTKLQEGLSVADSNSIVMLTGRIRAAANALSSDT